jgi:allophanate hydrolase
VTETVAEIVAAHRAGTASPASTVARSFRRIRDHGDNAIFISLRDEAEVIAEAEALTAKGDTALPLYGVPVAVKDNIDVAGLATTAACPAYSYMAKQDANAVARLRTAGAIMIGKTNLDQFATGLVGVRSPYGIPKNPVRGDLVPGGSSSGSAVAVSAGLVPLSLGTDTAGSGRVPHPRLRLDLLAQRRRRRHRAECHGRARRRRSVLTRPHRRPHHGSSRRCQDRYSTQGPTGFLRRP